MNAIPMCLFQFETVPVLHCYNAHAVVLTHKSGWKLAYSGDCLPSDRLVKAGELSIIQTIYKNVKQPE